MKKNKLTTTIFLIFTWIFFATTLLLGKDNVGINDSSWKVYIDESGKSDFDFNMKIGEDGDVLGELKEKNTNRIYKYKGLYNSNTKFLIFDGCGNYLPVISGILKFNGNTYQGEIIQEDGNKIHTFNFQKYSAMEKSNNSIKLNEKTIGNILYEGYVTEDMDKGALIGQISKITNYNDYTEVILHLINRGWQGRNTIFKGFIAVDGNFNNKYKILKVERKNNDQYENIELREGISHYQNRIKTYRIQFEKIPDDTKKVNIVTSDWSYYGGLEIGNDNSKVEKIKDTKIEEILNGLNITWEKDTDEFEAIDFDVFYENGLLIAIPTNYSDNVDVLNTKSLSMLSGENGIDYEIKDITINSLNDWRLPTYQEANGINTIKNYTYKISIYNQEGRPGYYGGLDYGLTKYSAIGNSKEKILLVKNATTIEKAIYGDTKLSYLEKIKKLAYLMTKQELLPIKKSVEKPKLLDFKTILVLEERRNKEMEIIKSKFDEALKNYNDEIVSIQYVVKDDDKRPGVNIITKKNWYLDIYFNEDGGYQRWKLSNKIYSDAEQNEINEKTKNNLFRKYKLFKDEPTTEDVKQNNISEDGPIIIKEEFETSVDFEKRKIDAQSKWEIKRKEVEQRKKEILRQYDDMLNEAELDYKRQGEKFADKEFIKEIYTKNLKKAVIQILGKPYFKDMKYDADLKTMVATVFSATEPNFNQEVKFLVPIETARSFKDDLNKKTLIPTVTLDNEFNIVKSEAVVNDKKIAMEYTISEKQNTIEGYREFINKYPKSELTKKVTSKISQIEEDKRNAEIQRQKEIAESEKQMAAKKEQEKQSYYARKKVGDKVTKPGKVAWIIEVTISGFVEQVSGDKIQIRITNTEGQSIRYNGASLYNGVLIWDNYYEWRK